MLRNRQVEFDIAEFVKPENVKGLTFDDINQLAHAMTTIKNRYGTWKGTIHTHTKDVKMPFSVQQS
jgi:hypothetical protein